MTIPTRYSTFHRSTMLTCHPMSHLPSLSVGLLPLSSFGSGQFFLHLFRWNVEERLGRWEGTKSGAVPEKLMSLPKKVLAGEHRDNSKKGEVLILCNYVRRVLKELQMVFACFRCSAPAPHWVLPRQHVSAQAAVATRHADHSTAPRPPGDAHISPKLSLLERRFCLYTWIHSRQTLLTFCILLSCICLSI